MIIFVVVGEGGGGVVEFCATAVVEDETLIMGKYDGVFFVVLADIWVPVEASEVTIALLVGVVEVAVEVIVEEDSQLVQGSVTNIVE